MLSYKSYSFLNETNDPHKDINPSFLIGFLPKFNANFVKPEDRFANDLLNEFESIA